MATMLAYILTDLNVPKDTLDSCLKRVVKKSFNSIFVMSSQMVPFSQSNDEIAEFESALLEVCMGLAEDIVRNGEGTQHVMKVTVNGAPDELFARDLGRFVTNSNLFKCAIAGCDPNVGRIVGAIGSYLGNYVDHGEKYTKDLFITLGGMVIFKDGQFLLDPAKEKQLSDYLFDSQLFPSDMPEHDRNYPPHTKNVDITIDLKSGPASCIVIGSDLTKEYVEVNADYRS